MHKTWRLFLGRGRWKWTLLAVFCTGGVYATILWMTLPDIGESLRAAQSTVILDRNGVELYRLFRQEDRTYIDGKQIPESMQKAIVAIEDQRFYDHGCIDLRAIARAVYVNIVQVSYSQGFSTISQQLARNAFLNSREKSITRKLRELMLSCSLERRYSKEKLLELYLNWIPFGQNAYGIEQASQKYFGTGALFLTLGKSAVLASLPQRPTYFNPYGEHAHTTVSASVREAIIAGTITKASQIENSDVQIGLLGAEIGSGARRVYVGGRADQVLEKMQELNFITKEKKAEGLNELRHMTFGTARDSIRAPHFVLWVKKQAEDLLKGSVEENYIEQGGLRIETSLDWNIQQIAESVALNRREYNVRNFGAHNLAMMAVDQKKHEVVAYIGNADYNDDEHSGKVDMGRAPRQPGSSFKPLVYAAAFQKGFSPATPVPDTKLKLGSYEPQNFDGQFRGLMTARSALGASRNIPAIKAYFLAGEEDQILSMADQMGAPTPLVRKPQKGYGPSLAIGSAETPLVEMVSAYATIAGSGAYRPLVTIRRIIDHGGAILYDASNDTESTQVLDPRVAYMVTSILSDATARPDEFWRRSLTVDGTQAAAKTGTSNKCLKSDPSGNCTERSPLDLWTMGYTPEYVAGVWVGNADASALPQNADGLNVAAPIWKEFMERVTAMTKDPVRSFVEPDGLTRVQVSLLSGQLPTACTPLEARSTDLFLRENPPTLQDPACKKILIDRVTGLLPSASCPSEATEERAFYVPWSPVETRVSDWISGSVAGLSRAPTEQCSLALTPGREVRPTVEIVSPVGGASVTFPSFHPIYEAKTGAGLSEVSWFIDGIIVNRETASPFDSQIRLPKTFDASGTHTLKVQVKDTFYNVAMDSVTFTFGEDRTPPVLTLMSPEDVILAPGASFTVALKAEDTESGVKDVKFTLLGQSVLKSRAPFTATLTAPLEPGTYDLLIVATNYGGRTSDRIVTVNVE